MESGESVKFKSGDRVKMKCGNEYAHGQITIVSDNNGMIRKLPDEAIICKVFFDEYWAPDYWYYPADDLELDDVRDSSPHSS